MAVPPLGLLLLALTPEVTRAKKLLVVAGLALVALVLIGMEAESQGASEGLRQFRAEVWQRAAEGLYRSGDLAAAEVAAWNSAELDLEAYGAHHLIAKIAAERQDKVGQEFHLSAAVMGGDGIRKRVPPEWLMEYGKVCLEAGKSAEVDKVLEKLEGARGKRAGAPLLQAMRMRQRGRLREAEDLARRLVDDFILPRLGEAYWELAEIAAVRGDSLSAAYFALESFRHGAPYPREVVWQRLQTWCGEAEVDLAPVRAFFAALQIRGPFGARGRPTELEGTVADRLCAEILEKYPDFWAGDLVLHTRGSHFFYQEENWEKALELYRQVLERYPRGETRCRSSYQMARALGKLERFGEAEIQAQCSMDVCTGDLRLSARQLLGKIRRQRAQASSEGEDQAER